MRRLLDDALGSQSHSAEAQKWEELSLFTEVEGGQSGWSWVSTVGMIPKSGGPDPQGCPGLMEELVFPEGLHWEASKGLSRGRMFLGKGE